MRIYIIVKANAYDGYEYPPDNYYTNKETAEKECARLNKKGGYKIDQFTVHKLDPIK